MSMPEPQVSFGDAVRVVRTMADAFNISFAEAATRCSLADDLRERVIRALESQRNVEIRKANVLEDPDRGHVPWLANVDRASWYYWRRLREYLMDVRNRPDAAVRSLDDSSDKVLGTLENPLGEAHFDTRGLVVGHVQSGKTASYAAMIAKAADAGYKLFIVLSGITNSLRQQTQRRLDEELVGISTGEPAGVGIPDASHAWVTFTTDALSSGDFDPGNVNSAALAGSNAILIVTKKNVFRLTRLIQWLEATSADILDSVKCLVIDDEADLASPNTGGNRTPPNAIQPDGLEEIGEGESPTAINACIRQLLGKFKKVAFVAYTATPYANVLMNPHARDIDAGEDLYPRSFIIALPKPIDYYGVEEIFGSADEQEDGMDVIRLIPEDDVTLIVPRRRSDTEDFEPVTVPSLQQAIEDFVLAGAAHLRRVGEDPPATMLIHPSQSVNVQRSLALLIEHVIKDLRDEWRYYRDEGIGQRLQKRWDDDFRRVTRSLNQGLELEFEDIKDEIGQFLEQVDVRLINYISEDQLDYQRRPGPKSIVIGGNRLSRGLTLEGLLVSYYIRPAATYDTLMQMGRWFGFRKGYADLTRIYTTETLASWFRDLADVEREVRDEISRYEKEHKTPKDFSVRIRVHPVMMVTSPLKMKWAGVVRISYQDQLVQTVTFPFDRLSFFQHNLELTKSFLAKLGEPQYTDSRYVWTGVPVDQIMAFLDDYAMDESAIRVKTAPIMDYIRRQNGYHELTRFVVGLVSQASAREGIGVLDLGVACHPVINLIERTKLKAPSNSLKAIATPLQDEKLGLTEEQIRRAEEDNLQSGRKDGSGYRKARSPEEGLLLIYPISKFSGERLRLQQNSETRQPLFGDPANGEHVIGIALSFPRSQSGATGEYWTGPIGLSES